MEVAKKFIKSMKSAKINWDDPIEVSVFQSLVSEVCQQALKNCCEVAKIREKRRRKNKWKSNVQLVSLRNS